MPHLYVHMCILSPFLPLLGIFISVVLQFVDRSIHTYIFSINLFLPNFPRKFTGTPISQLLNMYASSKHLPLSWIMPFNTWQPQLSNFQAWIFNLLKHWPIVSPCEADHIVNGFPRVFDPPQSPSLFLPQIFHHKLLFRRFVVFLRLSWRLWWRWSWLACSLLVPRPHVTLWCEYMQHRLSKLSELVISWWWHWWQMYV